MNSCRLSFGQRLYPALPALFALALAIRVQAQTTWYVDDDAPLGGLGTSWASPFRYLQDALELASDGDEIRVAGGVYNPDDDEDDPNTVTPGDRHAHFRLITGVRLEGGYAGFANPSDPDERDILLYESTLSADLNADDGPYVLEDFAPCYTGPAIPAEPGCEAFDLDADGDVDANDLELFLPANDYTENSLHVVVGSATDETAVLDGFALVGGNADGAAVDPEGWGGAIYIDLGNPTLIDCTIKGNAATRGAGLYLASSSAGLSGSLLTGNVTRAPGNGGAMVVLFQNSAPTVSDCLFTANSATGWGGAIMNSGASEPSVTNCGFLGNIAHKGGGAIANGEWAQPTLTNCSLIGNRARIYGGGALANDSYSSATLTSCLLSANCAPYGGGIWAWTIPSEDGLLLVNCTVSHNTATGSSPSDEGGGIRAQRGTNTVLSNCVLWGNTDNSGSSPEYQQLFVVHEEPTVHYTCIQDDDPNDPNIPFGGSANGNIDDDPRFVDADGPDDLAGTEDDNLRPRACSPCIDAADSTCVPADEFDLDRDGDTTERTPLDLALNPRFRDRADVPDTGVPDPPLPVVDMGAYEFTIVGDVDGDCDVDLSDLAALTASYRKCEGDPDYDPAADFNCDGCVDLSDLSELLAHYRETCD